MSIISTSESLQDHCLVDFVGPPCSPDVHNPSWLPQIFLPLSSAAFLELSVMFACGCLQILLSVDRRSLPDNDYVRLWSMNRADIIRNNFIDFFVYSVGFTNTFGATLCP